MGSESRAPGSGTHPLLLQPQSNAHCGVPAPQTPVFHAFKAQGPGAGLGRSWWPHLSSFTRLQGCRHHCPVLSSPWSVNSLSGPAAHCLPLRPPCWGLEGAATSHLTAFLSLCLDAFGAHAGQGSERGPWTDVPGSDASPASCQFYPCS